MLIEIGSSCSEQSQWNGIHFAGSTNLFGENSFLCLVDAVDFFFVKCAIHQQKILQQLPVNTKAITVQLIIVMIMLHMTYVHIGLFW